MEAKTELQRNALARARTKELDIFQRALDVQWMNNRMEDSRMGRCLALIQREADMEKDFQERTDHAAVVNIRAEKEAALGMEIASARREEAAALQRRQYLRERDPALRALATRLQAGYVCRDLRQQILHNHYRQLQDKAEEKRANEALRRSLFNDQEQAEREEKQKMERCSSYCCDLQQQLVQRQRQRQCQYEDSLVEKKMLDEIVRTISDEDKRELEQKRLLMEKTRREMEVSMEAQRAWRDKQRRAVLNEEKAIEQQAAQLDNRSAKVAEERERRMREKEELNDKIVAKILADQESRQHREDVIKQLQEQELLERNLLEDMSSKLNAERAKGQAKDALTKQMDERRRGEAERRRVDKEYRMQTEAKVAAEEEKEREKQRLIKEKNKKYNDELLQQVEQQRRRRVEQAADDQRRANRVWQYQKEWQAEVEEERKKIVEEHVPHLLGYLQAGVLHPGDLPAVQRGVRKNPALGSLDLRAMDPANRPRRFAKCNDQCKILREY